LKASPDQGQEAEVPLADLTDAQLDRRRLQSLPVGQCPLLESEIAARLAPFAHLLDRAEAGWTTYLGAIDATRYGSSWAGASLQHKKAWCAVAESVRRVPDSLPAEGPVAEPPHQGGHDVSGQCRPTAAPADRQALARPESRL